jgi:hypothetical protein
MKFDVMSLKCWVFFCYPCLVLFVNLVLKNVTYCKITFVWHVQDWTVAGLSDIVDYRMVPVLSQVLMGNFFVTASVLGWILAFYSVSLEQDLHTFT